MAKSVARNYIYNVAYQILLIALPLVTTPYVSRVLGVQQVGVYAYTNTVVAYFTMLPQLGLNLYGRRQIAYVRNDRERTTALFWELISIRLINFAIGLLLYSIMILCTERYSLYYVIFAITIVANALDITWFFQAYEEFGVITARNFIIKLLNVVGIFAFVRSADSLWKYILITVVGEFIAQVAMWFGIKRKIDFRGLSLQGVGKHLKGSIIMFLPQVITTIYTLTDKLMLGLWSTETEVGLYTQSEKIIKLTMAIIGSMGAVSMPRITNEFANGNTTGIVERLSQNRRFLYFMALPMIGGIFGIATHFTPWFFGTGYEAVSYLMVIISPIIILIALSDLFGMQYLIPTGHMKEYTLSTAGGAIINVILNGILIKKYAAVGVSIATVASELTVTVMMWMYARRYIKLKRDRVSRYVVVAAIMGMIVKSVDTFNPGSPIWTLAEILIGVVVYCGLLLILKDNMMVMVVDKMRGFLSSHLRRERK